MLEHAPTPARSQRIARRSAVRRELSTRAGAGRPRSVPGRRARGGAVVGRRRGRRRSTRSPGSSRASCSSRPPTSPIACAPSGARRSRARILAYRREHGLPAGAAAAGGAGAADGARRARPASRSAPIRSPAAAAWRSSAPCTAWAPRSCPARPTPTPGTSIAPARSSSGGSCRSTGCTSPIATRQRACGRSTSIRSVRAGRADRRGGARGRGARAGRGPALRPAAGHRVGDRGTGSFLLQSRPITSLRATGRSRRRASSSGTTATSSRATAASPRRSRSRSRARSTRTSTASSAG